MSHTSALFRKAAIDHRLRRQQPDVLLNKFEIMLPMLWVLCACALGIVLLMNQISYKEIKSARGRLVAENGELQLVAPASGLIHSIRVKPGEKVSEGDIVAQVARQLYDQDGKAFYEEEQALLVLELNSLEQQKTLQQQAYHEKSANGIASIEAQYLAIEVSSRELALLREQENISESLLSGTLELLKQRSISRSQASKQRLAHLDLQRERIRTERQLQQLKSDVSVAEAALEVLKIEKQQVLQDLARQIHSISLQLKRVERRTVYSVVATHSGVVSSVLFETGNPVIEGETLVYLQRATRPLLAEVFVPSSVLGKLAPGQEVMLRYDAFDVAGYGRYAAVIDRIERAALDPRQHKLSLPLSPETMFRILVTPNQHYVEGDDIYPLQPGLLLSADFVINELTMFEYIFKPVLNLRGKFT